MEKESTNLKNCIEKIKKTILMYSEEECKKKMVGMLEVLASRRSYLNLLFLKYSFEKIKKEDAVKIMEERNGFKILENTFTSTNRDFLNTLLELFIFLDQTRPVNINVLNNYMNIDKNLFFQYLSKSGGLFALFEIYEDEETYLDFIVRNVLNQYVIGDELQFLHKLAYAPRFQELKIDIVSHRTKFTSQSTYLKLLKLLQPEEYAKEMRIQENKGKEESREEIKKLGEEIKTIKITSKKESKLLEGKLINEKLLNENYKQLEEKYKKLEENYKQLQISYKLLEENSKNLIPTVNLTATGNLEKNSAVNLENNKNKIVKMPIPGGKKKILSFKKPIVEEQPVIVEEQPVKTDKTAVLTKMPTAGKKKSLNFKKPAPKSKLETTQLYCGLKWTKIPKTRGSIFSEVKLAETESDFTLEEFKPFEVSGEPKKAAVSSGRKKVENIRINYMDPKKSLNLDIALGRMKLSNEELYRQIVEKTFENENLVKQFLLYICTEEEFNAIKAADYSTLGRAEQFFYACKSLNELETSLAAIRFLSLYKSKDHKGIMENVVETYSRILNSSELKKLFSYLLLIGNQLNRNSFGSKAEAFSLDSLEKFKTKLLREFIISKFDMTELKKQLGAMKLLEPVDATIHEFMEVKSAYQKNVLNEEEYISLCKMFDNMVNLQKSLISYFNVDSDDKLVVKLDRFIKYFL
ncbi:hypothetical protein NUSPORA_01303 [Nucleospora cyclopteri]